jgi:hypothetical protein
MLMYWAFKSTIGMVVINQLTPSGLSWIGFPDARPIHDSIAASNPQLVGKT